MLKSAKIKNFILISDYYLEFSKGLYAITGTTGAGKSIIVDAVLFALGFKINKDIVKPGSDKSSVVLEFAANKKSQELLSRYEIEIEDELVIKAVQNHNNKKKFYINNEIVSQKIITLIAEELVEIHGQKTSSKLLQENNLTQIIDDYGDLLDLKKKVSVIYLEWQKNIRKKDELDKQRKYIEQEIDFLEHVTQELDEMNIMIGEEEELDNKRKDLKSVEDNSKLIKDSINRIGNAEIERALLTIQKSLMREDKGDAFDNIISNLDQAMVLVEEIKQELGSKLSDISEVDLEEIESRLFAIRAISRKHNKHPDELPAYLLDLKSKYDELVGSINNYESLSHNIELNKKDYYKEAKELSKKRKIVANNLATKILQEIKPLKMEAAQFVIEVNEISNENNYKSDGIDQINFLVSTNPGMPVAPIHKIASGGELSRFMLAIRVALLDKFGKDTMIFDEIDTGIGGEIASAVGDRLRVLGKLGQVITITHQPQVASYADHHMVVIKNQDKDRTDSEILIADKDQRIEEIARMLSSKKITDLSRKAAAEMIDHAQN